MTENNLTSTQKGKVTEQLVAAALLVASQGRLMPFVPLADDHGIDLIVLHKSTGRSLAIQVKSAIASPTRGTVQFDVRKAAHRGDSGEYLIMVVFDPDRLALAASWLIPMAEVPLVATEYPEKYALVPSLNPAARDRYVQFRHDDAQALTKAVLQIMER